MATTTATLAINSADIMGGQVVNITKSSSLTQADSTVGLVNTTGLAIRTLKATSAEILVDYSTVLNDDDQQAAKMYIKNTSTSSTQFVTITINSVEIARLYGGDFAYFPYPNSADRDVTATPSTTGEVTLEYMAIF